MGAQNVTPTARNATENLPGPSRELYDLVRGTVLIRTGRMFRAWCLERGWDDSNARNALLGVANGDDAQRFRTEILVAAGLIEGDEERTDR